MAIRRRRVAILLVGAAIAAIVIAGIAMPTAAQNPEPHTGQPAVVKQIAPDLYFFYDFDGSNSVFLAPPKTCSPASAKSPTSPSSG
jgi:hypothetical protein